MSAKHTSLLQLPHRQTERGCRVKFYQTSHLVQLLQQAKSQLRLNEYLVKLDGIPLLVLDDLGYVKKTSMKPVFCLSSSVIVMKQAV